jgi:hypothetical protein
MVVFIRLARSPSPARAFISSSSYSPTADLRSDSEARKPTSFPASVIVLISLAEHGTIKLVLQIVVQTELGTLGAMPGLNVQKVTGPLR